MDTDPSLYVVLIGVDDYATFDQAAGAAPGTSDLLGARADAQAWWGALSRLGARPDHARLLTSPALSQPGLPSGGLATRTNILAALGWLAAQLAADPRRRGFVFFGGHGAQDEAGGLVLCPSDCRPGRAGRVVGGLSYEQIGAAFTADEGLTQLTVVVDACHAAARSSGGEDRPRSLHRGPLGPGARVGLRDTIPALMACGPEERSDELRSGGDWNGAFTWSLLRVLSRWGKDAAGPRNSFTIAHDDLIARSGQLLSALGFCQTPAYTGPRLDAGHAFLEPRHRGATRRAEDQPRGASPGRELFPDVYDLMDLQSQVVGHLNVTGPLPMAAQRAGEVALYTPSAANPLLGLTTFSLRVHPGAAPALASLSCPFIAPNGVFLSTTGDRVPAATLWFVWKRVLASGVEVPEGHLGLVVEGNALREMVWVGGAALAGGFVPLAPAERFRFTRLSTGAPSFGRETLSLARDPNRLP